MSRMKPLFLAVLALSFVFSADPSICSDEFTFIVFGDSRPEKDLKQPQAFSAMIEQIEKLSPAPIFHTGDVIYGKTEAMASIEEQYAAFFKIVEKLSKRLFVAPGNHDIWDEDSAGIFQKKFGYLYHSVTFGKNHFILLNSELPGHTCMIDGEQLSWLEKELREKGGTGKNIFIVLHRPMFPAGRYIGKSMDKYPEKRDDLHSLFKKYGVRYVFSGHEHMYNMTEKDGIRYVITGGGGASLYADEDKGGFNHFIIFTVKGNDISFEIKKIQTSKIRKP